ncbi:unnamed protein product [Brassica oleracea var. botrytis]
MLHVYYRITLRSPRHFSKLFPDEVTSCSVRVSLPFPYLRVCTKESNCLGKLDRTCIA